MRGGVIVACGVVAAMLGGCQPGYRPPAAVRGSYRLDWHDEFNGRTLNPAKWAHYAPGPRRLAVNVPEAVALDGKGHLSITTTRHEVADGSGGVKAEYRTGMISTRGIYETTYGYFECRMRVQREVGHWSAFWINTPTMGRPMGDPANAGVEIDVMEYLCNGDYKDKAQHTIHWDHKTPAYQRDFTAMHIPGLGEGFHVYGCEWTPEFLAFYVDGRETWRTSKAVPRRDQHIILSVEIGPWAGDIREANLPDGIEVDYVRVFKRR